MRETNNNLIYNLGRTLVLNGVEYNVFKDMKSIPFHEIEELIWKSLSVVGFDNYEVNQFGQVRNIKTGRLIIPSWESYEENTYSKYNLMSNGVRQTIKAHKLVVLAFELGTKEELELYKQGKLEIDHIDRCRSHNSIYNLRLVTKSENVNGRQPYTFTRPSEEVVQQVFIDFYEHHKSKSLIAKETGLSRTTVRRICNRKIHTKITDELLHLVA